MEFLRPVIGDDLFAQLETAVNAWNGNEANKANLIKLANLAGGEYVGKGKYDALIEQLTGKQTELDSANGLIAELQKGTKDNEALQSQIAAHNANMAELQKQLAETKLKSAIKVALLSERATDIDYLTYKLEQKLKDDGKAVELDENENIKGWEDLISGLKTQFPSQFESSGAKKVLEDKLPGREQGDKAVTKEQFNAMNYEQRVALKKENETLYKQLSGKE